MYNLFLSADSKDWNGRPFSIDAQRYLEYTDNEIIEKYKILNQETIKEVKRFPCIFGYETQCNKNPKFGFLREVVSRQGEIRVEYEIISLNKFIKHSDFTKLKFELDIGGWELNRTHWAIKDVNLYRELRQYRIELPEWIYRDSKSVNISKHNFDVSLSFPGEFREYVEKIAFELERLIGPNSYFYDNNFKAQLARPQLDILLQDIYRNRSKLIVVFLSKKYQEKEWCGIEFRAISEIIMEKEHDRIMFIRMDDGKIEGVFKTDGYIDARKHNPIEIANFIKERINIIT
ncbi:toll/interleukin-1 receptor domain-containing protein [Leptospira wolffii]|uniref:Toll/interleukin-1 receptor domain-containing protein n=1 Tax=Leptospira wolffii TaxID=409998 RepID=A0ABV5BPH9_9LEPT